MASTSPGLRPGPAEQPARPYIGGQAVIEGVMMRAPGGVAVAVRRADGALVVRDGPLPRGLRSKLWKLPGLRGIGTLFESLSLGYSALQFSAEQAGVEDDAASSAKKSGIVSVLPLLLFPAMVASGPEGEGSGAEAGAQGAQGGGGSSGGSKGAMMLSTLLALGLFIALPQALATGAGWLFGAELGLTDWRFHALTGFFKLAVLTTYMVGISRIPEIRRVFQYHGAEHKTIFAYEAQKDLTVANVRAESTLHPRCGTTFLITVVIVSVILGSIITPIVLPNARGIEGQILTLALRISILPLIAAISYELQRFSARYCTTGPLRVLLYPGFLFQKITTREPDDAQIEVAIAAMQSAVWRERHAAAGHADASDTKVREFPSLEGALAHYAA